MERCLNVALPGPPGRRGWQRGAGELRCGKLRCRALLCSYNVLALLDTLCWWGIPPGAQASLTTGAIMVALLCEGMATEAYEVIVVWVNPINTDAGHVIRVTEK